MQCRTKRNVRADLISGTEQQLSGRQRKQLIPRQPFSYVQASNLLYNKKRTALPML